MKKQVFFILLFFCYDLAFSQCSTFSIDSTSSTPTSCTGSNDGSASVVSIANGSGNYSYLWNTGDTTAQISNINAGIYSVIVTDTDSSYGCVDSTTITVSNDFSITTTSTNISCFGLSDGSATTTISGGGSSGGTSGIYCTSGPTQPYYSNIELVRLIGDNDSISNNTAGTCDTYQDYTAMSTGLTAGQTYNMQINLGSCDPTWFWVDAAKVFVDWNMDDDFNDTGEEVHLVGPAQSPSVNNFTITVPTSAVGGNTRMRVVAQNFDNSSNWMPGSLNSTAFGACNTTPWFGSTEDYTLSIVSVSASASYLWSTGDTTAQISSLSVGTYVVTVNTNNCSLTDSVTITSPSAITYSETTTNVSCNGGNDGTAALTLSGGTPPYTYSWNTSPIQTTQTATNLIAGTYNFTITDSNGCSLTDSVTITEPLALTTYYTVENVSCFNGSDGSVTLYIDGGTTNYVITAFGFTLPLLGGIDSAASTSIMPAGVPAGIYPYVVTDANGCSTTDTVYITQPTQLSSSFSQNNLSACGLANGSINASILGGIQPYTFTWSSGDTTEDISNLIAGQYTLIVTDSNNCSIFDTITITQPSNNLLVSATTSNYNNYQISCNGGTDSITSTVSGGTPVYSYLWSDGQTSPTANNLVAGNYTLTVMDLNSCDYTISITLNQPTLLSNNVVSSNVLCNGSSDGIISVNVSGGVPNYNTNWGGIANPNALSVGNYIITTTDSNGCVAVDSVEIMQPNLLSGSIMITSNYNGQDVSCNGGEDGSVMASIFGGILPYNYLWSSGGTTSTEDSLSAGTYSLTITDSNNCVTTLNATLTEPTTLGLTLNAINGSCDGSCDGSLSATISGGTPAYSYSWSNNDTMPVTDSLCVGAYNLVIIDVNGCMIFDTAFISEPSVLTIISDSITDVSYFGTNTGFIYASVTGGNSAYSYSWTGPTGFSSATEDLDSVYVGTYILTVSDSLGCTTSMQFIVNGPVGYPLIVQADSVINVSCNGLCDGEIFITAEGGDSTYFYAWASSNGFTSNQQNINGLCAGIYDLLLSDSFGNIFDTSYQISEPNTLIISTSTDSATCYGGIGLATAYANGGTPSYSYFWNSGDSTQNVNLTSGTYILIVSDSNNCIASDTITIYEADSIVINSTDSNASCFGLYDGSISVDIISGGQTPFNYSVDNGVTFQPTNSFYNLAGDSTYYVIVQDDNGCLASLQTTISEPTEVTFIITATDATCYGYCDGTATLNIIGGTPSYTEDWGGLNPNNLCAGLVNISVTDANGCIATNSVTINEPPPLIVNISQFGNILDAGVGFASYQWLDNNLNPINGATSQQFTPQTTGEYSVLVTDANGCSATSFSIMFIADGIAERNTLLNIYPNPTKDKLNIQYEGFGITSLIILDVSGNIVLQRNDILSAGENTLQLNLLYLPKGMYVLQLISDKKIINHSVILQ